jgi:hypothetical protein
MFDPGPCVYMEKMAGGSDVADLLSLDRPMGETLGLVAERRACDIRDIMVVVLDRPRHEDGIQAIRDAGARVRLITDGDVSASLLAVSDRSPVSLLWGIGGTPEGVISAAAIKAFGGAFIGRLWPRDDGERQAALDAGYDLDRVLNQDELVRSDDCFFSATGVTDGDVLQGVRYEGSAATTESIVMRARTGTVRPRQRAPQPAEAARLHRRALRLEEGRGGELDAVGVQVERARSCGRSRGRGCRSWPAARGWRRRPLSVNGPARAGEAPGGLARGRRPAARRRCSASAAGCAGRRAGARPGPGRCRGRRGAGWPRRRRGSSCRCRRRACCWWRSRAPACWSGASGPSTSRAPSSRRPGLGPPPRRTKPRRPSSMLGRVSL